MSDVVNGDNIYLVIPKVYKKVYEALLIKMSEYGVSLLNDCSSTCKGENRNLLNCWNMFQSACAAYNTGEIKKSTLLINYIINQLCLDINLDDEPEEEDPSDYSIQVTPNSIHSDAEGGEATIDIVMSDNASDYTVTITNNWISYDRATKTITVRPNNGNNRVGFITFTTVPGGAITTIEISQDAKTDNEPTLIKTVYDTPELTVSYNRIETLGGVVTPNVRYSQRYTKVYSDGSTTSGYITTGANRITYVLQDKQSNDVTIDTNNGAVTKNTANTRNTDVLLTYVKVTLYMTGSDPVERVVPIYQKASTEVNKALNITPNNLQFNYLSGTEQLTITDVYNNILGYKIEIDVDWISYDFEGKQVSVVANDTNKERTGTIKFIDVETEEVLYTLNVTQSKNSTIEDPLPRLIPNTQNPINLNYNDITAKTVTIQVTDAKATNVKASIVTDPDNFIIINQTPKDVEKNGQYSITIQSKDVNPYRDSARVASIKFSCDEGRELIYTINQVKNPTPEVEDPVYVLEANAYAISFNSPEEQVNNTITITDVYNNCGALSINKASSSGIDEFFTAVLNNGTLSVRTKKNTTTYPNNGFITIEGENGGSVQIIITQPANSTEYFLKINNTIIEDISYVGKEIPIVYVSSQDSFNANVNDKNKLVIYTNMDSVELSSGVDWLNVSNEDAKVYIDENNTTELRSAGIYAAGFVNDEQVANKACTIVQKPYPAIALENDNYGVLNIGVDGDTINVGIVKNTDEVGSLIAIAKESPDWLDTDVRTDDTLSAVVRIKVRANETTEERRGEIIISPTNGNSITVHVHQLPHSDYYIDINNSSTEIDNKTINASYQRQTYTFGITTNAVDFKVTKNDADNIIESVEKVNNGFKITLKENTTSDKRYATVVLNGLEIDGDVINNCKYELNIVQDTAPSKELIVNKSEVVIPFTGGQENAVTIKVTDTNNNCGDIIINNGQPVSGFNITTSKSGNITTITIIANKYTNTTIDKVVNLVIGSENSAAPKTVKVTQEKHPILDYVIAVNRVNEDNKSKLKVEIVCATNNIRNYIPDVVEIIDTNFTNQNIEYDDVNNKIYVEYDIPKVTGTYTLSLIYYKDAIHQYDKSGSKSFTIEVINKPTYAVYHFEQQLVKVIDDVTKDDKSYYKYVAVIDNILNQDGDIITDYTNTRFEELQILTPNVYSSLIKEDNNCVVRAGSNEHLKINAKLIIRYNDSDVTIDEFIPKSDNININDSETNRIYVDVKLYMYSQYLLYTINNGIGNIVSYQPNYEVNGEVTTINMYQNPENVDSTIFFELLTLTRNDDENNTGDSIDLEVEGSLGYMEYDKNKLNVENIGNGGETEVGGNWFAVTAKTEIPEEGEKIRIYSIYGKLLFIIIVKNQENHGIDNSKLKVSQNEFTVLNTPDNESRIAFKIIDVESNLGDITVSHYDGEYLITDVGLGEWHSSSGNSRDRYCWITVAHDNTCDVNKEETLRVESADGYIEYVHITRLNFENKDRYLNATKKAVEVPKINGVNIVTVEHSSELFVEVSTDNSWIIPSFAYTMCNIGYSINTGPSRTGTVVVNAYGPQYNSDGSIMYDGEDIVWDFDNVVLTETITVIQEDGRIAVNPDDYGDAEFTPNIDPTEKENAKVGDIICSDKFGENITIGSYDSKKDAINSGDLIPIGVVAVPYNHRNDCSIIGVSLAYMDTNNPEKGNVGVSGVKVKFGNHPISNVIFTDVFGNYANEGAPDYNGSYVGGYAPIEFLHKYHNVVQGSYYPNFNNSDKKCAYIVEYQGDPENMFNEYGWIPSPYDNNEELIDEYSFDNVSTDATWSTSLDTFAVNPLLVASAQYGKTEDVVENSNEEGHFPAAICCYRYRTVGTNKGQWVLPGVREWLYILARMETINETIAKLPYNKAVKIFGNSVGGNQNYVHSTSTTSIKNDGKYYTVDTGTGVIGPSGFVYANRYLGEFVRAVIKL